MLIMNIISNKVLLRTAKFVVCTVCLAAAMACGEGNRAHLPSITSEDTLKTPPYRGEAVKYIVADNDIVAIEFTSAGNYMVVPVMDSVEVQKAKQQFSINKVNTFLRNKVDGNADNVVCGRFSKKGKNVFDMENYGTLKRVEDGKLDLSRNNGAVSELIGLASSKRHDSDKLNAYICRTWELTDVETFMYDENDKELDNHTFSRVALERDYNRFLIMTEYGSFVSVGWDGKANSIGKWKWSDPTNRIFRYRYRGDVGNYGYVQVDFDGNMMYLQETFSEYDITYEQKIKYVIVSKCRPVYGNNLN